MISEKVFWQFLFGIFRAVLFLWFTKDLQKKPLKITNILCACIIMTGTEMLRYVPIFSAGNVAVAVVRQFFLFIGAYLAAKLLTGESETVNFYFGAIYTLCLGMWKNLAFPFVISTIGISWWKTVDSFSVATQWLIQMFLSAIVLYILKTYVLDFSPGHTIGWLQVVIGIFPSFINQLVMIVLYQTLYYDRVLIQYKQNVAIAGLFLMLPVSSLLSLVVAEHFRKQEEEHLQIQKQRFQVQMVYHEMEVTRQKDEELRAFRHDIKRHMNTLQGMMAINQNASEYMKAIVDEMQPIIDESKSGNGILDVIIQQKKQLCKEKGIEFQVCLNYEKSNFMEQMDLCTIFSNAIDNAIEAVENEQPENKTIQLQGGEIGHCLMGKIINPSFQMHSFQHGLPVTTKQKKESHGYGLKNIEKTVKKYGGVLRIQAGLGEFCLSWTIPIPKEIDQL